MNVSDLTAGQVASPCIGICQLDTASECLGCGRLIGEIIEWPRAAETRRRDIVRLAAQRQAVRPVGDPK